MKNEALGDVYEVPILSLEYKAKKSKELNKIHTHIIIELLDVACSRVS